LNGEFLQWSIEKHSRRQIQDAKGQAKKNTYNTKVATKTDLCQVKAGQELTHSQKKKIGKSIFTFADISNNKLIFNCQSLKQVLISREQTN